MKMMAKICLALTLLLTLPGLAAAAQGDRFDQYDRIDRARLLAEIQRDVREAVRRARRDSYYVRRDALREARQAILEARRDARRQMRRAMRDAFRNDWRWRD